MFAAATRTLRNYISPVHLPAYDPSHHASCRTHGHTATRLSWCIRFSPPRVRTAGPYVPAYLRPWVAGIPFGAAFPPSLFVKTMPPTRKRTKEAQFPPKRTAGKQKLRGRRGSLEAMPGIPLDVIIEVCLASSLCYSAIRSLEADRYRRWVPARRIPCIEQILDHLHPRDILSLARTSKPFRALLMNRRNAFIWKAARTALPDGLPDPHPFLSEPALAHLMFTSQCHVSACFDSVTL